MRSCNWSCCSGLPTKDAVPAQRKAHARSRADRAVDAIRKRFGGNAVDYGSASRDARLSLTSSDALPKESFEYRQRPLQLVGSAWAVVISQASHLLRPL